MGVCVVGRQYGGLSRDHWFSMLDRPRKAVAQWHPLSDHVPLVSCTASTTTGLGTNNSSQPSVDTPSTPTHQLTRLTAVHALVWALRRSDQKVVKKLAERFSEVAGRNLTKLEMDAKKYPFRTRLFYNFEKLPRFCTKAAYRRAASEKKVNM